MALSWNEINDRALNFSKEWANAQNEEADAKPFLDAFFDIFGIPRKKVGTFEYHIRKVNGNIGKIDLLWKGVILIEMKSKNKNLDAAFIQAKNYVQGLALQDTPKYILVCDFQTFRLFGTEESATHEFALVDLVKNIHLFAFIAGYQKRVYKEQDPVNIRAADLMGRLHDRLNEIGYEGHPLEVFLVRLLFCLFAEDSTIFEKQQFQNFIEDRTAEDGSDLASKLQELFQTLNTPTAKRFKNLDEDLNAFPYVNGKLFDESLPTAAFDKGMRQALLDACYIDWSLISPAIFGSMFQSVMNPQERRNLGAHYTSEKNILKLIKPLFLDDLWKEFELVKESRNKLAEFHKRISTLKFLDPACGCGNFLVITYRELRLLELAILRTQYKTQTTTNIESIIWLDVDMMYGIEYEEFPVRIAEVAMWLIDHQMNMLISNEFGQYFVRLPLYKAAKIVHGDALKVEWQSLLNPSNEIDIIADHANIFIVTETAGEYNQVNVLAKSYEVFKGQKPESKPEVKFNYILGNPPFIGSKIMKQYQRDEVVKLFGYAQGSGILDYVTAWYIKAAKYIQDTDVKVAFVSTNSIIQGEQTSVLWDQMLNRYDVKIHFAHRTFKWSNEAKGNAAVYCVIIGFANYDTANKHIYVYDDIQGEAHELKVKNINPYLVDANDVLIPKRSNPICKVPKMIAGNVAYDYGYYVFSEDEMNAFILREPNAKKWFKKLIGGRELINNEIRYCLWLKGIEPQELKSMKFVLELVAKVKSERLNAKDRGTHRLADRAYEFRDLNNPNEYIAVPKTSSEHRKYIPIAYFNKDFIPSDSIRVVENGTLYHFGVLTSLMHIAWVKYVCGRLKSDFRYSKDIVYNNFPWPENMTVSQMQFIGEKAQKVLDVRTQYPDSSLADLYDLLTMPVALIKAHSELDKVVDAAYRTQAFSSETKRMEFLFDLYEKYTANLFTPTKVKKLKLRL